MIVLMNVVIVFVVGVVAIVVGVCVTVVVMIVVVETLVRSGSVLSSLSTKNTSRAFLWRTSLTCSACIPTPRSDISPKPLATPGHTWLIFL